MIDLFKKEWLFYLVFLLLSLFLFFGMDLVPFHPDESTQIYMSQDLFDIFKDPLSLSYKPGTELSNEMTYRAIDMPLTRYLIGLARLITGTPNLASDWNWALSWEQNKGAGAIPSSTLLTYARFSPTFLLAISLYLFYFSIRKILPKTSALISTLFLGLNPLILLHGRRAMSEPALLFGITLFFWAVSRDRIKPFVVGIALALAFNAKQTGIFLVPVGIIAVCTLPDEENHLKDMLARSAGLLAVFLILTLLLNPYYWDSPFSALVAGYQSRSHLFNLQIADHLPGGTPNFFSLILNLISNLFILPPAVSEISKYLNPMAQQIQVYKNILPHIWGRGLIVGSLQLAIFLSGFYVMKKRYPSQTKPTQQNLMLLLMSSLIMAIGILLALPIPWQRYIVPLLPLVAFWFGCGSLPFIEVLQAVARNAKRRPGIPK